MKKFTTTLILLLFLSWLVPTEKLHAQDLFECELDFTLTPIGLCGDDLGMVEVNITGGFGTYHVCWVSNNNSINETETVRGSELRVINLPAGAYSFLVTDEFSKCSKIINTMVDFNFLRGNFEVNGSNARCNGLGSIAVNITGNNSVVPPYNLTITGPVSRQGVANNNQFKIFNLPSGDYEIKFERDGCRKVIQATVGVEEGLPDFELVAPIDDCGINIGAADVLIQDGEGPFQLSWEGPTEGAVMVDSSVSVFGLQTGAYKFTVEDAEGCSALRFLELNATSLALSTEKVSNALNGGRGFVKLAIQGGVPGFSITWDGIETGERTDIIRDEVISLPAGTFDLEVTDAAGCSDFITITIEAEIDAIGLNENSGGHRFGDLDNTNLLTNDTPLVQQNYPNPFDSQTTIQFSLPTSSEVEFLVHDHFGRLVMTKRELLGEGQQQIDINANDLATGLFFYTIITDDFKVTKRMIVR